MNEIIFSHAENAEGKIVFVDDVPNGLQCGCICPNCHEPLIAKQGDVNQHGFAHHSNTRKATLEICYNVTLYKLAEQIVMTQKCIHAPSYFGIFGDCDLRFAEVQIDSSYDRVDKQPDVIATTEDGKSYLIEFIFSEKVSHKRAIDYKNLSCLEVDLSNQKMENLEDFLLKSNEQRRWLNNHNYFESLMPKYAEKGYKIRVVDEDECMCCDFLQKCCAIKNKNSLLHDAPIVIDENGKKYRICKPDEYDKLLKDKEEDIIKHERLQRIIEEDKRKLQESKRKRKEEEAKLSNH